MAIVKLMVGDETGWELGNHLPILWSLLFDWDTMTESRRLHATAFEGAALFQERSARLAGLPLLESVPVIFEEIRPEAFPRALSSPPDVVLRLDLSTIEGARPYRHERACAAWERLLAQEDRPDRAMLERCWEEATLTPLRLPTGSHQRDALAVGALAGELRLPRDQRARALAWCLFGRPLSRPARALTHAWIDRIARLPVAAYRQRRSWLAALLRRRED